jgi:hypothetical protein
MTVKFNKKSNTYTIYNKFETHNNLEFSRLYRNTYFNNYGISVFKNEEKEKIVLVLTKAWSEYTSKIYSLDLQSWRKLDDNLDDLSDIDALCSMIERFF